MGDVKVITSMTAEDKAEEWDSVAEAEASTSSQCCCRCF